MHYYLTHEKCRGRKKIKAAIKSRGAYAFLLLSIVYNVVGFWTRVLKADCM